ncbi:putative ribonuclease H-like domain-containing protein, partial [Tanacetum coccineum]
IIAGDGPKWLFDIDVLTKSMNYVPVVTCTNSNDFVVTKESIGAGHSSKEPGSSQDYILMPLWKDGSLFDYSPKNISNDEPQPSSDAGKKDDDGGIDNQEGPENSSQDVNTAGPSINTVSTNISTGSLNINTISPSVTTTPLEATHADFFGYETKLDMSNITNTYLVPTTPSTRILKDHSLDHVIGNVQSDVQTRRMTRSTNEQGFISTVYEGKTYEDLQNYLFACFLSQVEPKKMDVKSAFLYGKIEEEVYVCQSPRFEDPEFPNKVYKEEKALYGLHQDPRAWYETLSTYLLDNGFKRGQIDKTLFIKRIKSDILLVQVYVNDIIFGSTKKELCTNFEKLMYKKFQMSSIGELSCFLGLQTTSTPMETSKSLLKDSEDEDVDVHLYRSMIGSLMYLTASRPNIMFAVCACARFQVTLKVSHLHAVNRIFRYLKGQPKLGLWYPKDSPFNLEAYTDSDYVGASLDRKSRIGCC